MNSKNLKNIIPVGKVGELACCLSLACRLGALLPCCFSALLLSPCLLACFLRATAYRLCACCLLVACCLFCRFLLACPPLLVCCLSAGRLRLPFLDFSALVTTLGGAGCGCAGTRAFARRKKEGGGRGTAAWSSFRLMLWITKSLTERTCKI